MRLVVLVVASVLDKHQGTTCHNKEQTRNTQQGTTQNNKARTSHKATSNNMLQGTTRNINTTTGGIKTSKQEWKDVGNKGNEREPTGHRNNMEQPRENGRETREGEPKG